MMKGVDMKKLITLLIVTAFLFSGCTKSDNRQNMADVKNNSGNNI